MKLHGEFLNIVPRHSSSYSWWNLETPIMRQFALSSSLHKAEIASGNVLNYSAREIIGKECPVDFVRVGHVTPKAGRGRGEDFSFAL